MCSQDLLEYPDLQPSSNEDTHTSTWSVAATKLSSEDRLCAVLEKLSHLNLTGSVELESQTLTVAGGGCCDVFIGYVVGKSGRIKVAVRQLRPHIILKHDFRKVRP